MSKIHGNSMNILKQFCDNELKPIYDHVFHYDTFFVDIAIRLNVSSNEYVKWTSRDFTFEKLKRLIIDYFTSIREFYDDKILDFISRIIRGVEHYVDNHKTVRLSNVKYLKDKYGYKYGYQSIDNSMSIMQIIMMNGNEFCSEVWESLHDIMGCHGKYDEKNYDNNYNIIAKCVLTDIDDEKIMRYIMFLEENSINADAIHMIKCSYNNVKYVSLNEFSNRDNFCQVFANIFHDIKLTQNNINQIIIRFYNYNNYGRV